MKRNRPLVSRVGLKRTPLRPTAAKAAPQGRKRPSSRKPQQWADWRAQERGAVVFRAMAGRGLGGPGRPATCEWPGCDEGGTEWHHLFGRRMEPWSSSRLLTVLTCKKHHDQGHAAAAYRQLWRLQPLLRPQDNFLVVMARLAPHLPLDPPLQNPAQSEQWFRYTLDVIRLTGIQPPDWPVGPAGV